MAVDIIARALASKALQNGGGGGSGCDCQPFDTDGATVYEVGGIPAGTVLKGKTWQQILTLMLYGEEATYPTLTPPSFRVEMDEKYGTIGASVVISGTAYFDRGKIDPAYGTSGYRAGLPTSYVVNGSEFATTTLAYKFSFTADIQPGDNRFEVAVNYGQGEQPKDSLGGNYDTPYPAGSLSHTVIIDGTFPIYLIDEEGNLVAEDVQQQFDEDGVLEVTMVAEKEDEKQTIAFPTEYTDTIVGVQQYDPSRDLWDWIYGSPQESLKAFTLDSTIININGIQVNYTTWTNATVKLGERKLRFFTKLPSEDNDPPIYVDGKQEIASSQMQEQFATNGYLKLSVAAEKEGKQSVSLPTEETPEIVGVQQYDPSRDTWDWIYGSPEESLKSFDVSTELKEVGGKAVSYTTYTNNTVRLGERSLKFCSATNKD